MKFITQYFPFILKHKYKLMLISFVVWVGILDSSSIWNWTAIKRKNTVIEQEIVRYQQLYQDTELQLRHLQTNDDSLERLAREQYYMNGANEEVFLIEELP